MNQYIPFPSASGAKLSEQPDFVTALARGLAVIRAFDAEGAPTTLAEIARRVGLSRATVRRSLITLEALGYVENDGKIFALTPQVLSLGYSYLSSMPLARASKPCLEEISSKLNESAATAILDRDEVILLVRVPVVRSINPGIPAGSRFPAYCTATGRVLLAGLPDDAIDEYLSRLKPERLTPQTETDVSKIRSAIFAARNDGYSVIMEQSEVGVRSISVPVTNPKRRVVAALNITAPMRRVTNEEMIGRFLPFMRSKAQELSSALA